MLTGCAIMVHTTQIRSTSTGAASPSRRGTMLEARLSRRNLLRVMAGAAAGTAVGGLAGLGADIRPAVVRAQQLRIREAKAYPSVCPYCAVGCDTIVHVVDGQIVNIEGDVNSPINQGNLCPKGAATFQLHVNPNRL